mmetsp:Transcript_31550/g.86943  ORF Transcript_31550/g.86943 Transcript_31550/m.86943 type:complete len:377 (+) Transcript_31550:53-1183(+)
MAETQPLHLSVAPRALTPEQLIFGATWLAPGGGSRGDGDRLDPGQENADATIAAAVAAGIREFDTAPWYGSGTSEERLGRALLKVPQDVGVRVFTKAGRLFRDPDGAPCLAGFDAPGRFPVQERVCSNDYTATGARLSLSESLDRIGVASVFGLRIHDPNDNSCNHHGMEGFVDEVAIALGEDGMCAEFRRLREAGTVAHFGLGMNCNREAFQGAPDDVLRLLRESEAGTFDSALLAGGWNLLSQAGLPCFAECERLGIEVHVAGVFASGVLVTPDGTYAYRTAPSEVLERVERWRSLATRRGLSLPAVAIAFASLPRCVTRMVIGMASPEQVEQTMAWVAESAAVPASLWAEARAEGLLQAYVPVPEEGPTAAAQ